MNPSGPTVSMGEMVSACGLYCGACHKFKKGRCPGCRDNHKASWCKIRPCAASKGISTCADCPEVADVMACKKFNTLVSRFFALVFRSDRQASLALISDIGPEAYGRMMAAEGKVVIKR